MLKISTFHFKNCSNIETQLDIFLIPCIKNLLDLKIHLQIGDSSVQHMHLRDEFVLDPVLFGFALEVTHPFFESFYFLFGAMGVDLQELDQKTLLESQPLISEIFVSTGFACHPSPNFLQNSDQLQKSTRHRFRRKRR